MTTQPRIETLMKDAIAKFAEREYAGEVWGYEQGWESSHRSYGGFTTARM
jgi:hypothetical protein